MNEICPYCGEPQRFPICCADHVVACRVCGKEYLFSNKRRDLVSQQPTIGQAARTVIFQAMQWQFCVFVFLLYVFLFFYRLFS
jgi:hypothetical protein